MQPKSKRSIILMGGGGHCSSVIDVIESTGDYLIEGIIDKPELIGRSLLGYKYIARDEDLPEIVKPDNYFLITVGQTESNDVRIKLFCLLSALNANFATVIAPSARVSKHAVIGKGTVVMHNAFVNAGSVIGENTIVNTAALIEHDCSVGNHCHISTCSVVNGEVKIGDDCFIGSNSVIRNGIIIGRNTIVGAGAVVINNTEMDSVYVGNPARKIR